MFNFDSVELLYIFSLREDLAISGCVLWMYMDAAYLMVVLCHQTSLKFDHLVYARHTLSMNSEETDFEKSHCRFDVLFGISIADLN